MTTDKLLNILPSHIGNHKIDGLYVISEPEDCIEQFKQAMKGE